MSRRGFLKAGGVALGTVVGAGLPGAGSNATGAVIQIYLPGGPSHLDTFDPKPGAPSGVRGEFRPAQTGVTGLHVCEYLPELASLAPHLTVVRGLTGLPDAHNPGPFDSGTTVSGHPGLGAAISYRRGSRVRTLRGEVPTAVDLSGWTSAGQLGDGLAPRQLGLPARVRHFDELCINYPDGGAAEPGPLGRALDLRREPAGVLGRYGAAAHAGNALFLKARRLVEAGVRCVAFAWGYWDTHGDNFGQLRRQLPLFDRGLSALIEDLRASGRLDDVLVVVGGEFGRTPKINGGAGRDHWPHAGMLLLAGGGLPHGRVVGATDRLGAEPTTPVRLETAFAPVHRRLGLGAADLTTAGTG
jgi:hypothetical protein